MTVGAFWSISVPIMWVLSVSVFGDIEITPNEPQLVLNEGDELTIKCRHSEHMNFRYPKEMKQDLIHVSNESHDEVVEDGKYFHTFRRLQTVYGDAGWYGCTSNNENDFLPDCAPQDGKSIYVFVKSNQSLFVQKPNNYAPVPLLMNLSENVTLPCRPSSPDYKVHLFSNNKEIIVDNRTVFYDPRCGFKIINLKIFSFYECVINELNRIEKIHYSILFKSKEELPFPEVNFYFKDATVGERITANCSIIANDYERFLLNWTFPSTSKGSNKEITIIHFPLPNSKKFQTISKLTISNVTLEDEGNYICTVKTQVAGHNNKSTHIQIKIHDENEQYIQLIPRGDVTDFKKESGDKVEWVVQIKAHPPANYTWFNPKQEPMLHSSSNGKYTIQNMINKVKLTINNLSIDDRGIYSLHARNGRVTSILNFTLEVISIPMILIDIAPAYYKLHEAARISCRVIAYPKPNISWVHSSCPVESDNCTAIESHLPSNYYRNDEISDIYFNSTVTYRIHESGVLYCKACNILGCQRADHEIWVTEYVDGFEIIPSLERVVEGDNLVLDCGVSLYNYTNNTVWLDESLREIRDLDKKITIRTRLTPFSFIKTIELHDVQSSDSQIMICVSTNKDNFKEERTYNLTVHKSAAVSMRSTNMDETHVTVKLDELDTNGEKLFFYCFMDGSPFPNITWYKDGVIINGTDQFEINNRNQEFRIKYLHARDSGTYTCKGQNRINEILSTRKLTVIGKNVSVSWIIAVVILMILCIVLFTYFWLKIRREQVLRKQLTAAGLMYFEKGALECLNPELTVDDQADLLPYDKTYEFPRHKLKLGKQLGSGAFGVVLKAEAENILETEEKTTVAVKMVRRSADPTNIRALASELKILIHLGRHLNVVNLLGACTENILKCELLVIVEYCRYGNVHNYLLRNRKQFINQINPKTGKLDVSINIIMANSGSSMSEFYRVDDTDAAFFSSKADEGNVMFNLQTNSTYEASWGFNYQGDYNVQNLKPISTHNLLEWAFQVARGMDYLSKRKVLHGDLAARNILLSDKNVVKICDFGLAKTMYKNDNYEKKGDELLPVKWLAIESIRDRIFSTQSDVWSYGIVLWELFTLAKTPYPGMEAEKIYQKLTEGYRMEQPDYATKEIYDVMLSCWKTTPVSRPSFECLVERIGEFLQDNSKEFFINLNTPYTNMNSLHYNSKEDYLELVSAPDFSLLSSPTQTYVNTSLDDSVIKKYPKHDTRKTSKAPDPAEEALLYKSSINCTHSRSTKSVDMNDMINDEDDENYLKPINIHKKRAEFIRQKKNQRIQNEPSNSYCNTPSKTILGCSEEVNYSNMLTETGSRDPRGVVSDSFSNPTYGLMDTVEKDSDQSR